MSLLDKPVSMHEVGKAVVQDFGAVSQRKLSEEKHDLSAVWESMYEKGLHRKVSAQYYFKPENLESQEHETSPATTTDLFGFRAASEHQGKSQDDQKSNNDDVSLNKRDLASVHLDRAKNTSRAHWHNEGRRYRRRTFSREDSKPEN